MTFNKPPEWGSRFSFHENLKTNFDGLQMSVTQKIVVQMQDDYETVVVEEIASAARSAGVTDCTVLNKKAILEAINKQIPKKPTDIAKSELYGKCALCGQVVRIENRYCDQCGQALDWEDNKGVVAHLGQYEAESQQAPICKAVNENEVCTD